MHEVGILVEFDVPEIESLALIYLVRVLDKQIVLGEIEDVVEIEL